MTEACEQGRLNERSPRREYGSADEGHEPRLSWRQFRFPADRCILYTQVSA